MRKFIYLTMIFILAAPLAAQKPSKAFMLAQATASGSIIFDTAYTYDAIWNHNCYEGNPFWAKIYDNPPLVMALDLAACAGISLISERLYKEDKALGWAFIIGVHAIQGYMLYLHLRARR